MPAPARPSTPRSRSEEHTSELQSHSDLVCRLLLDPVPTYTYPLSLHDALPILSDKIGRRPLLLFSCIAYIVLGYPFFLMAASGSIGLAILAQLLMVVLYAPYAGTCPSFYTEI